MIRFTSKASENNDHAKNTTMFTNLSDASFEVGVSGNFIIFLPQCGQVTQCNWILPDPS
jgi:hypothetical protein